MVSTRGVRYKFSEGERVLCYEPDPTKAKVLYDSKVLEVIESRDKRGRRVEYLIHFQGWNSSWDRCVSEDFVLKDTEENRQLQRDLAEKSQLQLGAYLYRRERKKGTTTSVSVGAPAKRARHGFSDDGSSSSTQPEEVETAPDTDSSVGSGGSSQTPASPPHSLGRVQINLPPQLRDSLTFDYHLIMKRSRLYRLPASPCAAEVLEMFVRWFARSGAWRAPRQKEQHKPNMLDVCCRLNLVREVADGIRVYFDFILKGHLLYRQERKQYQEYCGQYEEDVNTTEIKREPLDNVYVDESAHFEAEVKSPKTPEYSHLPPDPDEGNKIEDQQQSNPDGQETAQKVNGKRSSVKSEDNNNTSNARETRCSTRSGTLARRLRSHKSAVSEPEETSEVPAPPSSAGSSESAPSVAASTPPTPARTPLSLLLDKVAKWQIIPREDTEHLPCRVYGAIHLARLFVKLPGFLNATQMPDMKLKLILKYIDMFTQDTGGVAGTTLMIFWKLFLGNHKSPRSTKFRARLTFGALICALYFTVLGTILFEFHVLLLEQYCSSSTTLFT